MSTQLGGYVEADSSKNSSRLEVTATKLGDAKVGIDVNTLPGFQISDTDTSSDVKYYGYLNAEGEWYIMQETTSLGIYRYFKGTSAYSTNWTGRAGLSYDYWDVVF